MKTYYCDVAVTGNATVKVKASSREEAEEMIKDCLGSGLFEMPHISGPDSSRWLSVTDADLDIDVTRIEEDALLARIAAEKRKAQPTILDDAEIKKG